MRATERRHREAVFWAKVAAFAAALAIPVAILLVVTGGSDPSTGSAAPARKAKLRVSLELRNFATVAEQDAAGELHYTKATQPRIFINLRNDGGTGTAIDRVELIADGQSELQACDPRGGEAIAPWTTGVLIRRSPEQGATLTTDDPVAYNIDADDAGRIELRLRPSKELLDDFKTEHLFRFRVRIRQVSNASWLEAGAVVVLLPRVWPPDFDNTASLGDDETYRSCTAANRASVRELAQGAELSDEFRALL